MADSTITVWEGGTVVVLSRVTGTSGANITQSVISTLTQRLVRMSDGEVITSGSLTVSSQVYNSLQTWTFPSGQTFSYNFKHIVTGANLATGGDAYQQQYTFTDTDGYSYLVIAEIRTKEKA